jgi:hypothetical protein
MEIVELYLAALPLVFLIFQGKNPGKRSMFIGRLIFIGVPVALIVCMILDLNHLANGNYFIAGVGAIIWTGITGSAIINAWADRRRNAHKSHSTYVDEEK